MKNLHAFGDVLNWWVFDGALPSAMKKEFPWLKMGKVSECYELGNPVEGDFIQSWDALEKDYRERPFPPSAKFPVLMFVAKLREAGYDRKLRAGTSVSALIVSRSRRHRLRPEQQYVKFGFNFDKGTMSVLAKLHEEENIARVAVALSYEIEVALAQLVLQPID